MLGKERQLYIMKRLQNQPTISVSKLCEELNVSVSTVRRDLKILEDDGRICRERGGAVNKDFEHTMSTLTEQAVVDKLDDNYNEKIILCKEAAKKISDGELIFIDSGTTAIHLIPYIKDKNIKIVTNSNLLLSRLAGFKSEIYVLGGLYNEKSQVFLGPNTMEQISKFRFDHAFITANGIDIDRQEVYTTQFELGAIKQLVMDRSKYSHLLIDSSKHLVSAICTFANLSDFDNVFTDELPHNCEIPNNLIICNE